MWKDFLALGLCPSEKTHCILSWRKKTESMSNMWKVFFWPKAIKRSHCHSTWRPKGFLSTLPQNIHRKKSTWKDILKQCMKARNFLVHDSILSSTIFCQIYHVEAYGTEASREGQIFIKVQNGLYHANAYWERHLHKWSMSSPISNTSIWMMARYLLPYILYKLQFSIKYISSLAKANNYWD